MNPAEHDLELPASSSSDVAHLRRTIRSLRLMVAGLLIVTIPALALIVYTIHGRGGLRYALLRLSAMSNENTEPRYRERTSLFDLYARMPQPDRPVVFLGDSLIERCEWQELVGNSLRVVNRGISGDTTDGVEKRLQNVVDLHPRAVFLLVGSNDFSLRSSPAQASEAIRGIARKLADSGTTVYLQSLIPSWIPDYNRWAREVNRQIPAVCDNKRIIWVPLFDRFLQDNILNPKFSYDGIHLNAAAFAVWKDAISGYLAPYEHGS